VVVGALHKFKPAGAGRHPIDRTGHCL